VINAGSIPSMTYNAVQRKIHPQDTLRVSGKGIKVVSGGLVTQAPLEEVRYKAHRPEVQFLQVPGNGKVEFQFLITGKGEVNVAYQSVKAGKAAKAVVLQ
jgi:hypothetical protein